MVLPAPDLKDHKAYHPVKDPHLVGWVHPEHYAPVHHASDYHVPEASTYAKMPTYYDAHTAKDINPQVKMDFKPAQTSSPSTSTTKPLTGEVEWVIDGKGNLKKIQH